MISFKSEKIYANDNVFFLLLRKSSDNSIVKKINQKKKMIGTHR